MHFVVVALRKTELILENSVTVSEKVSKTYFNPPSTGFTFTSFFLSYLFPLSL